MIRLKEVAQHAGVAVGTVSNVLNRPEKVSPDIVERVQLSIAQLGFIRNDAARQLRAGRSNNVAMLVLDLRNRFSIDIVRGAEDEAFTSGRTVTLANVEGNSRREANYLDLFEEQRVHGVLVSPVGDIASRLERLRAHGIPSVLVDRLSPHGSSSSVSVDDVAGGVLATEHLIVEGRRRIAFVGGPLSVSKVSDRLRGARRAILRSPGVALEIMETIDLTVEAGRASGLELLSRRAAGRPDAVFAANDLVAIGLLQAFTMQPAVIRVPEDIALIGYDDIDFASAGVIPLSSIRQPNRLVGRTAMIILLEEARFPSRLKQQLVLTPALVARQSSRGMA